MIPHYSSAAKKTTLKDLAETLGKETIDLLNSSVSKGNSPSFSQNYQKLVTRHVWEKYVELAEDVRHSPEGKAVYQKRKETIERVFADAKVKHGLRFTQFRGIARLKMQVLLTFACMNLKKLAKWKKGSGNITTNRFVFSFYLFYMLFNY